MIIILPNIPKLFRDIRRRIWAWNARSSIESEIARETCDTICEQSREIREEIYNRLMKDFDNKEDKKMAYCLSLHRKHIIPKPRVWGK